MRIDITRLLPGLGLAALVACGGQIDDGAPEPSPDAPPGAVDSSRGTEQGSADARLLSFTIAAHSVCPPECPEGHAILSGARVGLFVRGLPRETHVRTRSNDPTIATIVRDVRTASCLSIGLPPGDTCGDVEYREVEEMVVATAGEGDVRIEIVDDAERVLGSTTLRVRRPTEMTAVVAPQPSSFLGPAGPPVSTYPNLEAHVGDKFFVKPVLRGGGEVLAFYDGVSITTDDGEVLLIAPEINLLGVNPARGSKLVHATAPGMTRLVVGTRDIEWAASVRVTE